MQNNLYLSVHPADNVLVALQDLKKDQSIAWQGQTFGLAHDIPAKHKFTTEALETGQAVVMYGVLIGKTTQPVPLGGLLTPFNLKHAAEKYSGKTGSYTWQAPDVSAWQHRTFLGYHRADGQVGTRNYWLVVPLVFCENHNIETIKEAFLKELGFARPNVYQAQVRALVAAYQKGDALPLPGTTAPAAFLQENRLFENVDGIRFLTHESGCGGTREDAENLCSLLAGYAVNPNVAGITVLSLGCQHAQIALLRKKIAEKDPTFSKPLYLFEQQQSGSEFAMLSQAVFQTFEGLLKINAFRRKPAPLSELTVGVKCGGSDGFSGISANPAVGYAADLLVALGGKVMMAEFPELCGVEQEILNRCTDEATASRFALLMEEYASRAKAVGSGFDMNPSPGNIKDGLITDAIKSAGAAKKGGTSPVTDVLGYGQYVKKNGLSLLCTPGNDVEATTGMAGSGCTIQLFTTGLGTPTGNPVSPMVKLATNHTLAQKMPDLIDLDCGGIITGEKTIEETGAEILEYVIRLASGEFDTKAMQLGQDDFIFWKRGVSL